MKGNTGTALYIRVSSEEQVDGYSLAGQTTVLTKDVTQRGNYVYQVYEDAGVSGAQIERPALQALLRDAKRGLFREVLVWNISRMSRNLHHLLTILEEFKHLGIVFRSLKEQFDSQQPMGIFALTMMGAVAQMQRESWMESSAIGMRKRAKSGRWSGGHMLGYRMADDPHDPRGGKTLTIVPEEAALVKEIFTLYASGLGYKAIVNQLNLAGKSGKCGKAFSLATVQGILKNAAYVGLVVFGNETYRGLHQPIISAELWQVVEQRLLGQSKPVRKIIEHEYLLSGFLRCPACGSGMIPQHTKNKRKDGSFRIHHYYACSQYVNKGKSACRAHCIRADVTEKTVLAMLAKYLTNEVWRKEIIHTIQQRDKQKTCVQQQRRQELQGQLDRIAKQQSESLQRYENDWLDRENFQRHMQILRQDKEQCQQALQVLDATVDSGDTVLWSVTDLERAFTVFQQILVEADQSRKKTIITLLISAIPINADRQIDTIEWNIQMGSLGLSDIEYVSS